MKIARILFQFVLTTLIFSLWAAFALLIVNPLYKSDLPGYTIGRICIWEYIAIVIAIILSQIMIKKWGAIDIQKTNGKHKLTMDYKYGYFFLIYFFIALFIAIWQFWLFSQKF